MALIGRWLCTYRVYVYLLTEEDFCLMSDIDNSVRIRYIFYVSLVWDTSIFIVTMYFIRIIFLNLIYIYLCRFRL